MRRGPFFLRGARCRLLDMSMTIVLNNQERPIVSQFRANHPAGAGPAASLVPGEQLMLTAGINLVSTDKLAKLRSESPLFAQMFTDKIVPDKGHAPEGPSYERIGKSKLEVLVEKDVDPKAPFAKLKDATLVSRIIRDTYDENLLKAWVNSSGNENTRAEIYKQLEFVRTGNRPDEVA